MSGAIAWPTPTMILHYNALEQLEKWTEKTKTWVREGREKREKNIILCVEGGGSLPNIHTTTK